MQKWKSKHTKDQQKKKKISEKEIVSNVQCSADSNLAAAPCNSQDTNIYNLPMQQEQVKLKFDTN